MGGTANGWRTITNGEDWMRNHEKRLLHEERRAAITQASDILGPGFDSTAIPLDDWNGEETIFNGLWYSTPDAANAPDTVSAFAGQTITYSDGTGIQIAYSLTEPPVMYQRNVTVNASGVRVFGAWTEVAGGGGGGGAPTGPAGGDLTGSYPNPEIAPNAVTSAEIANATIQTADLAPATISDLRLDVQDEGAATVPDATAINFVGAGVTTTASGTTAVVTIPGSSGAPTGPAGGELAGTYPNPTIADNVIDSANIINGSVTAADLAPGTIPTTLPPSGPAGGDLTGTYPNPTIAPNAVTSAKVLDDTLTAADVNSAYKDGTNSTPSMRTLGYGPGQAMEGGRPLNWIVQPDGAVTMNGFNITNLATPVSPNDAANKSYVDTSRVDIQDEGVAVQPDATTINFVGAGVTTTAAGGVATVTIPGGGGGGTAERPVGEVTMWYGTKAACPSGWLIMDGSTFSAATYPALNTLLGGTTLPDMTDKFVMGAGISGLGTTGGSATRTLVDSNMTPHSHTIGGDTGGQSANHTHDMLHGHQSDSRAGTGGSTVAFARTDGSAVVTGGGMVKNFTGDSGTASVGHTHALPTNTGIAYPSGPTPFSIIPPYRAMWFMIRAL